MKKINDNLSRQIKTLFNYWFTQFDFPNEHGLPYRSSGGEMVFNPELNKKIPLGWSVASIATNPISNLIKPGLNYFDKKEYLATANINGNSIISGDSITFLDRESRANMQPSLYSVWFAKMKNSTKHLFLNKEMQYYIDNTILSTGFCGIQCSAKAFEFISSLIDSDLFEIKKDILAHGATQEAVNNDDLDSIKFALPPNTIIEKYHSLTKSMFSQYSISIIESMNLTNLRNWLLPMLMNGQATTED